MPISKASILEKISNNDSEAEVRIKLAPFYRAIDSVALAAKGLPIVVHFSAGGPTIGLDIIRADYQAAGWKVDFAGERRPNGAFIVTLS